MCYGRFSKAEFVEAGKDSDQAAQLAEELEEQVAKDVQKRVEEALIEIVGTLNGLGHELEFYSNDQLGDIEYRDDRTEGGEYFCDLRLGSFLVVSAGFSHLENEDREGGDGSS